LESKPLYSVIDLDQLIPFYDREPPIIYWQQIGAASIVAQNELLDAAPECAVNTLKVSAGNNA